MPLRTALDSMIFEINNEFDVAQAILEIGKFAGKIGFNHGMQNKMAIITSELAKNILHHSIKGTVIIRKISNGMFKGIEIEAKDQGPGIENIEKALTPHYSSKKTLGLGLPAVKRLADEFEIDTTVGIGTSIRVRKWLNYGKN